MLRTILGTVTVAISLSCGTPSVAAEFAPITIAHYAAPSFGGFLPAIIKSQKFDSTNGLDITFVPLPPDAYSAAFNSGQYQVGASGASLTIGLSDTRGVPVVNLFNVFDFWCAVVTSRPDIKSLKDLEGKDLAAARGTASYQIFEWAAKHQGVDLAKLSVVNTAPPGLIGYAVADKVAAVQLWEPAYSILLSRKPNMRTLDIKLQETWKTFSGSERFPYQGVAAHRDWVEKNPDLIGKLFRTYQQAGAWTLAHPEEAARIILAKNSSDEERKALASLISAPERLGLNVRWADELRSEINALYKLGIEMGVLGKQPSAASIYSVALK